MQATPKAEHHSLRGVGPAQVVTTGSGGCIGADEYDGIHGRLPLELPPVQISLAVPR